MRSKMNICQKDEQNQKIRTLAAIWSWYITLIFNYNYVLE